MILYDPKLFSTSKSLINRLNLAFVVLFVGLKLLTVRLPWQAGIFKTNNTMSKGSEDVSFTMNSEISLLDTVTYHAVNFNIAEEQKSNAVN